MCPDIVSAECFVPAEMPRSAASTAIFDASGKRDQRIQLDGSVIGCWETDF
jgi:hypothetical protein